MDDQNGNVIDGTERARQWRRSRSKADRAGDPASEARSAAPKSIASSLLVPAEMLEGALAAPPAGVKSPSDKRSAEPPVAEGEALAAAGVAVGGDDRNLFLSPDAAVIEQPPQRRR